MASLSFKNINKIYSNNVQAVFDFNLEIKDKEFIVFVGPSGCGKSTTLRMVAGLEEISSGQLYIDGVLVNDVVPKDRNIAMVFQNYALYPHFTVYQNMAFALKLRKIKKPVLLSNPETAPFEIENKEIRREIGYINRQFKKKQNSDHLLPRRAELYKKLYSNEEKIANLKIQAVGIDELGIKEAKKLIKKLNKQLSEIESAIAYADMKIPTLEGGELYATKEAYQTVLTQKSMKVKALNEAQETLSKLETTEVPLYEYRHLTRNEIDIEINKAAESLDLIRYLFRKPAALSGGQRQRVALGRAIVRKPKVFLMDEPLSNLDAKLRVQTRGEITRIHKRVGATSIYVTHDQTEAMTMADRIVIMSMGYIQQIGTPDEVYGDPTNMFVAGFIGSPSMNFLEGIYSKGILTVQKELTEEEIAEGKKPFEPYKFEVSKKHAALLKDFENKKVVLGVRPEFVHLKDDSTNNNPSKPIQCNCDFSERLGDDLYVYSNVAGQRIIGKLSVADKIVNDQKIEICFDMDKVLFFDGVSTNRIR